MKNITAPNGIIISYKDNDEHKVSRIIQKAKDYHTQKYIEREKNQMEYYLKVRARHEAWENKKKDKETESA